MQPQPTAIAEQTTSWRHPIRTTTWPKLNDDEDNTAQTIALMRIYAVEDSTSDVVGWAVQQALGRCRRGQVGQRIHAWLRANIRFRDDSAAAVEARLHPDSEVLIRPVDLLAMESPGGDCDDFSMLAAAMLLRAGETCSYVTIAADPRNTDLYSHVYVEVNGMALDASHGPWFGWAAPAVGKTRRWPVTLRSRLAGLPTGASAGVDWGSILQTAIQTGSQIAVNRYGQPPVGTYIQNGQGVFYRGAPNQPFSYPTFAAGSSSTLLIVAGLLVVVLLMGRNRG